MASNRCDAGLMESSLMGEAPGLQSKPHSIVRKSIALSDVMLTVFVRTRVCCHLLHVGVSTVRSAKGEISGTLTTRCDEHFISTQAETLV